MLTGHSSRPAAPRRPSINTYKGQDRALRAGRIGTAGLLLSVLAASAPLLVVAGVMPTTYAVMGISGQPLLFVILGVLMALFGIGYAEMSRHVHNAGAFYAYIARGLGGTAGSAAAFVALVSYNAMQIGVYGIFGAEASYLLGEHLGLSVSWWIPALAALAVTGVLGALKVDLNARIVGALLVVECLLVLVSDIAFAADPGPAGLSFTAFEPGALSGAGLGTALCFTIAAFVGFEQAPVYAEETNRPHKLVPRVMFLAVGFVAVFFALSSWLMGVATGPGEVVERARAAEPGQFLFLLTEARLGATFTDLLHVLFVTGIFACMLSFHNVVARYTFAMGREGLLPARAGRTSRTSGAPAFGSLLQSAIALAVVACFVLLDRDPVLDLFTWLGNVGALGIIVLMTAALVAVISFFVRRGAARAQAWRLAASGTAVAAFLVIIWYAVTDFYVLLGADPGTPLRWALPGVVAAAALGGAVIGVVLRVRRPWVHARIGLGNEAFQMERAAELMPGSSR